MTITGYEQFANPLPTAPGSPYGTVAVRQIRGGWVGLRSYPMPYAIERARVEEWNREYAVMPYGLSADDYHRLNTEF